MVTDYLLIVNILTTETNLAYQYPTSPSAKFFPQTP
jgi:hypothetical protein